MKVDNSRLDIVLAKKRLSLTRLRGNGVSPQTVTKMRKNEDVLPATVGKLAKALGVSVTEIIKREAY
jgi:DNA-binding Xre family transcriptional regulator